MDLTIFARSPWLTICTPDLGGPPGTVTIGYDP
jgi:hypothetical protein